MRPPTTPVRPPEMCPLKLAPARMPEMCPLRATLQVAPARRLKKWIQKHAITSFINSFIHSFSHSFILSLIHPIIHSFSHSFFTWRARNYTQLRWEKVMRCVSITFRADSAPLDPPLKAPPHGFLAAAPNSAPAARLIAQCWLSTACRPQSSAVVALRDGTFTPAPAALAPSGCLQQRVLPATAQVPHPPPLLST